MTQRRQPAIPRLAEAIREFFISQCGAAPGPRIDIVAAPADPGDPDMTVKGRMHFQIAGFVDVANFNRAQEAA